MRGHAVALLTAAAALVVITGGVRAPLGAVGIAGLAIWAIGMLIEVIADRQKSRFRADPDNKGAFIDVGLWAWSRHPNYFGEIVLWTGLAIVAVPVLHGWQWATLVSPVFVTVLLTRISGVPPTQSVSCRMSMRGIIPRTPRQFRSKCAVKCRRKRGAFVMRMPRICSRRSQTRCSASIT